MAAKYLQKSRVRIIDDWITQAENVSHSKISETQNLEDRNVYLFPHFSQNPLYYQKATVRTKLVCTAINLKLITKRIPYKIVCNKGLTI